MQKIGEMRAGLTAEELAALRDFFRGLGLTCRLVNLQDEADAGPEAWVLLVKNGFAALGADAQAVWSEMKSLGEAGVDRMFLNARRGIVQNKRARWNFNVADAAQTADIAQGKGTVYAFEQLPELAKLRKGLARLQEAEESLSRLEALLAEANVYYSSDTGIGFHGDSERQVVIGACVGVKRSIEWQAFEQTLPVGERIAMELEQGDVYFMDVAATGHSWKANGYRSLHFRHRAGFEKWLKREETQNERKWAKRRAAQTNQS
jgi:hypothetical protein